MPMIQTMITVASAFTSWAGGSTFGQAAAYAEAVIQSGDIVRFQEMSLSDVFTQWFEFFFGYIR